VYQIQAVEQLRTSGTRKGLTYCKDLLVNLLVHPSQLLHKLVMELAVQISPRFLPSRYTYNLEMDGRTAKSSKPMVPIDCENTPRRLCSSLQ
jgi:hypothetical protein